MALLRHYLELVRARQDDADLPLLERSVAIAVGGTHPASDSALVSLGASPAETRQAEVQNESTEAEPQRQLDFFRGV